MFLYAVIPGQGDRQLIIQAEIYSSWFLLTGGVGLDRFVIASRMLELLSNLVEQNS